MEAEGISFEKLKSCKETPYLVRLASEIVHCSVIQQVSVRELLTQLGEIDWSTFQNIIELELDTQTVKCSFCGKRFSLSDLSTLKAPYNYFSLGQGHYCQICISTIEFYLTKLYKKECTVCHVEIWTEAHIPLCAKHNHDYYREVRRVHFQNQRAKQKGLSASLTFAEWIRVIELHHGKCAYCKLRPFTDMDHIIPISKGGGTTRDNVIPSCRRCNLSKGRKSADRFLRQISF